MRFKLPSFTLVVRDLTEKEWANQGDRSRDYMAITITALEGAKGWRQITVIVGSAACGGDWGEAVAARSAISFASEPSAWDAPSERTWSERYGEQLSNEAFNHRTLGVAMRRSCG